MELTETAVWRPCLVIVCPLGIAQHTSSTVYFNRNAPFKFIPVSQKFVLDLQNLSKVLIF